MDKSGSLWTTISVIEQSGAEHQFHVHNLRLAILRILDCDRCTACVAKLAFPQFFVEVRLGVFESLRVHPSIHQSIHQSITRQYTCRHLATEADHHLFKEKTVPNEYVAVLLQHVHSPKKVGQTPGSNRHQHVA